MKRKLVLGLVLAMLLTSMLTVAFDVQALGAENGNNVNENSLRVEVPQSADYRTTLGGNPAEDQARVLKHEISASELENLKREIGVWDAKSNYCPIIDGHGTGLRPPTEQDWVELGNEAYVVDNIFSTTQDSPPASVDLSQKPWFPPIGNQGSQGSCVAFATGYYTKTFQEGQERAWNLSGSNTDNRIISPAFIYHLINNGTDGGSWFQDAINVILSIGACSLEKMPYDDFDATSWPGEDAWREAPLYRGDSSAGLQFLDLGTEASLTDLKTWISSGNLAIIAVDSKQYYQLTWEDVWMFDNYVSPLTDHANTIVGYDDNFQYEEEGQTRYGAFKIANSWGLGPWPNGGDYNSDGCYWISYKAMMLRVQWCMFYSDVIGYQPQLVASFRVDHSKRAECNITVGMGDENSPIQTKRFDDFIWRGGDLPFCPNDIFLDVTEFTQYVPSVIDQSFFLKVGDANSSTTGTITRFAIEYAQSTDVPIQTVNNAFVYAHVTLHPFEAKWTGEKLVALDADFIDDKIVTATDSNGYLYVAYADLFSLNNLSAIFVGQSIDGGSTWFPIQVGYDSANNLGCPSIAIDPQSNDLFVAAERERYSYGVYDHDVFVLRRVGGSWSWSSVANDPNSDDRFPSITSEYSYGGSNRQYVSYEHDALYFSDLMFAKSTDHGASWTVTTLHSYYPDFPLYTQISITNAEGHIYVAYKWCYSFTLQGQIRVDVSADFGSSWTQYTNVDGLTNDCSFPSIVASHGGDSVMVAFQYQSDRGDFDVWYTYSADNGSSWAKGNPLFASEFENEVSPVLTVDGMGSTSNNVRGCFCAFCKSGSYIQYKKAYYGNPLSWSIPECVSERWVGKGLAATTQMKQGYSYPCVLWTCERSRGIYVSQRAPSAPGDVNADGVVDVLDAAAVSAHWFPGPPAGPLGYDANFDINSDGATDVLDAAIVSAYWTGPPKGPLVP